MKKQLDFNIPFSGYTETTFINCFASTYVFLEGITGNTNYKCNKNNGQPCNGCGNCRNSASGIQEKYFFLFDTVCGRSSLRWRFDSEPTEMEKMIGVYNSCDGDTDNNVDFLFGFAGYEYRKSTDPAVFKKEIIVSIDAGKPVIASVKSGNGRFRVITGCDGENLVCPDFTGAQQKPEGTPSYAELEIIYIIGNKITPRYTLLDGLKRIKQVMEYNINEKLWDGYIEKMGWYAFRGHGLENTDLKEKQARMKRVSDTMWQTFNCHNFAEVFRHRYHDDLKNQVFDDICNKIGGPCFGWTHDLAWALIDFEKQVDWSALMYPCGSAEMIELTLSQIKKNDIEALDAVKQAIDILQQK